MNTRACDATGSFDFASLRSGYGDLRKTSLPRLEKGLAAAQDRAFPAAALHFPVSRGLDFVFARLPVSSLLRGSHEC
jgi:hypothetical protein